MDLLRQFHVLGGRQLAAQEGIEMLRETQRELRQARSDGELWGQIAVLSNLVLIPLNCIINAYQLKKASSLYQLLVRSLYDKVARSGTRIDGTLASTLDLLKQAIVGELKRQGMTAYIPGVNILVGLAEDSMAAMQALQTVQAGSNEMKMLAFRMDRQIVEAERRLMQLGIERAQVLSRMQLIARTA